MKNMSDTQELRVILKASDDPRETFLREVPAFATKRLPGVVARPVTMILHVLMTTLIAKTAKFIL